MDKQRYIDYAIREWKAENITTIYESEDKAIYAADTKEYGAVIIKLNDDLCELMNEYTALIDLSGDYCVKYYACLGGKMITEERVIPGNTLREVEELDLRILCFVETFNAIHRIPKNEKMYPTYIDWLKKALEFCIQSNVSHDLVDKMSKAMAIGEALFEKYSERYLLHGDLHHDNLLLKNGGKYTIIDPKGVIGPKIFDTPRFVLNELDEKFSTTGKSHILNVIDKLANALNYEESDIRKLFFMEAMLANIWCIEDGEDIDESAIEMACEILQDT